MREKNIVGSKIRQIRKDKHYTQAELARQLQLIDVNVDRVMISKIEIGIRPVSDIEIAAIAKIFKISVLNLFEDSETIKNLK